MAMTDEEARELMKNYDTFNETFKKGQTMLNDIIGYYNMFEKAILWLNRQIYGESTIEDREAKIKSLNEQKEKLNTEYKKKLMSEPGVLLKEDQADNIEALTLQQRVKNYERNEIIRLLNINGHDTSVEFVNKEN